MLYIHVANKKIANTVPTMAVLSGPWSYLSRSSRYVSPYVIKYPELTNITKTAPEIIQTFNDIKEYIIENGILSFP